MFKPSWRSWIACAAIAAAVIPATAMIASPQDSVASAALDTESPLLVSNRAGLQVCGDVAPGLGSRKAEIFARLDSQMRMLKGTHPTWSAAYGSKSAPRFSDDCTLKMPTRAIDEADATALGKGMVTRPSAYRAVVVVLDDKTADVALGDADVRRFPYEMMKVDDHSAVEVTNGIAVRESFVATKEFVQRYLSEGLGLAPGVDESVPSVSGAARQTKDKTPAAT